MKEKYKKLLEALVQEYGEGEDLSSETSHGLFYFHYRWAEFEIYQPYWYDLLFYMPCKPLRKLAERLCDCKGNEHARIPLFGWDCATDYVDVTDPQEAVRIVKRTHKKTLKSLKQIKKILRKGKNHESSTL